MTYAHAVEDFLAWIDRLAILLPRIEPVHVAAYVELITRAKSAPTVKTAPRGDPHAVRLAGHWPGRALQPG
jgi:integrase/recombinase XerC